jgi:hypothetical protein
MITMLGSPRRCCDGLTRRETLQAGALALLGGMNLPTLLRAEESRSGRPGHVRPGKAKNVILLYLLGGAATQDMVDLKPGAPAEICGEFKPIATNVAGIQICEHLPRMASWMHKVALVRSLNHKAGCHNCLPSYTGYEVPPPDQHPRDTDPPSMGQRRAPTMPGHPRIVRGEPYLPNSILTGDFTIDRLNKSQIQPEVHTRIPGKVASLVRDEQGLSLLAVGTRSLSSSRKSAISVPCRP